MKTSKEKRIQEKLLYREPMQVTKKVEYGNGYVYPVCPRCQCAFNREYQAYCDRCGQCLKWKGYDKIKLN